MLRRPLTLCALVALLTLPVARVARAEEASAPDTGSTAPSVEAAAPRPVRWHASTLILKQSVGTTTLGVGADYQSRNPFHDVQLAFRPRYYLWEREPSSLSLRAQLASSYEVTNSDSTTKRNELLLEDSLLSLVPERSFGPADERTLVALSLPRLVLPSSFASRRSGKVVELGVRALVDRAVPLRTTSQVLPRAHVAARVGYGYQFVTGTVPSSDTLSRLRMDLDGNTARNGQLGGAAFAEHVGVLRGIAGADLYADWLGFEFELGIDPAYKRKLPPAVVTNIATGPVPVASTGRPQRLIVNTYLDTAITLTVKQVLRLAFGYENITNQLGNDGQRRGVLYSPDAKFYLAAELTLDKAYEAVAGSTARKRVARSP